MARCSSATRRITDDDLLAFSRRFGDLDPPPIQEHGRQSPEGYPDIYVVSNVLDDKGAPIGALGAGEAVWHTDMSYLATAARRLDALFAGSPADRRRHLGAWHAGRMGDAAGGLKAKVRGRRIKHDGTYNSGGYLRKGVTPTDDPHKAPGAWHPAVISHPATGAPSLYLGRRRNSYVEGFRSLTPMRCSMRSGRTSNGRICATSTAGASAICCCGTTAPPCTGATRSITRRAASCIARRSRAKPPRASGSRRPKLALPVDIANYERPSIASCATEHEQKRPRRSGAASQIDTRSRYCCTGALAGGAGVGGVGAGADWVAGLFSATLVWSLLGEKKNSPPTITAIANRAISGA